MSYSWPCFVIAVREEVLEKQPEIIKTILKSSIIQPETFKEILISILFWLKKYHQKTIDIQNGFL
jgi:hypothetical protein